MTKQKLPIRELLAILIGEILVSSVVCGIYFIIKKYTYKIFLGVLLGTTVTFLNFLVLSIMTNNVINGFLAERGDKELTEEEATELSVKFQGKIQAQMKISFLARIIVLVGSLVAAFVSGVFDPLATVIPILMMRPIIMISQLTKRKAQL